MTNDDQDKLIETLWTLAKSLMTAMNHALSDPSDPGVGWLKSFRKYFGDDADNNKDSFKILKQSATLAEFITKIRRIAMTNDEKRVLCKDCEWFDADKTGFYNFTGSTLRCMFDNNIIRKYDPIFGEAKTLGDCRKINANCNCPDYKGQPLAEFAGVAVKPTWWQRLMRRLK